MSFALRQEEAQQFNHTSRAAQHWESKFTRRLVYADTLVVTSAVFGAQVLWVRLRSAMAGEPVPVDGAQPYASLYSIAIVLGWLALLAIFDSRDRRILGTGFTEYRRIVQASFATFGSLAIVVYLFNLQLARGYFFIAFPVGFFALFVVRYLWRKWLVVQRKAGEYSSRVVLAGSPESVTHIAQELQRMPEAGYYVLGVCVPPGQEHSEALDPAIPVAGTWDDLLGALETTGADTIVITSSDELPPNRVRELSWQLEPGNQHLIVAPSLTDIGGPRIHTRPVAGLPLIHVETPRYTGGKTSSKRIFDVIASAVLVILLAPVLAGIALAVKLGSQGPVLYRQERIGINGQKFKMLKFRSMVTDAEKLLADLRAKADVGNQVLFKMKDDPRVTPIGRILRRYSLDELPQLFNVLAGHMSLIGPRPPLASEVEEYENHVHRRFLVKPGITGLWQVSGRSDLSWEESVRLDLFYVENWTITGDLLILLKTAKAVLAREGAY